MMILYIEWMEGGWIAPSSTEGGGRIESWVHSINKKQSTGVTNVKIHHPFDRHDHLFEDHLLLFENAVPSASAEGPASGMSGSDQRRQ